MRPLYGPPERSGAERSRAASLPSAGCSPPRRSRAPGGRLRVCKGRARCGGLYKPAYYYHRTPPWTQRCQTNKRQFQEEEEQGRSCTGGEFRDTAELTGKKRQLNTRTQTSASKRCRLRAAGRAGVALPAAVRAPGRWLPGGSDLAVLAVLVACFSGRFGRCSPCPRNLLFHTSRGLCSSLCGSCKHSQGASPGARVI